MSFLKAHNYFILSYAIIKKKQNPPYTLIMEAIFRLTKL